MGTPGGEVRFSTEHAEWVVGADGVNKGLYDKRSGQNYLAPQPGRFAAVRLEDGRYFECTSVAREGDLITVRFEDGDYGLRFRLQEHADYVDIRVVGASGPAIDRISLVNMPLTLEGTLDERFAASALALNMNTNVDAIPGPTGRLSATASSAFGLEEAHLALVACPPEDMRRILKEVVSGADTLPHSPLGGPWALDAPETRGSYLIDITGALTEASVQDWISAARACGMSQIDLHTGHSFRFGDYVPDPGLYPDGLESIKRIVDAIHEAGMLAGLHTYAQFVAKNTPWVTPVPDHRLMTDESFTLTAAVGPGETELRVEESTADVSTVTGFHVPNSVTLRMEDELVVFFGVKDAPPYGFSGCERGALGTMPADHPAGTKVHQLKECFGLFVPDPSTGLYEEVAKRQAEVVNQCDFDMMYLDALDGSFVVAEKPEDAWFFSTMFVFDLWKYLDRPVMMEMSTFHHHLWYVRSRMGAWDIPARAYKRFIDMHVLVNQSNRSTFLPSNLGWWAAFPWKGVGDMRTFPDDFEYLLCKSLGYDWGVSLAYGFTPDDLSASPYSRKLAEQVKDYEDLRRAGYFPEAVKRRLREPGAEFTLESAGKAWRLRKTAYASHTVADGMSAAWTVHNPFGEQGAALRIEALLSLEPGDYQEEAVIADWSSLSSLALEARDGVRGGVGHAIAPGAPVPSPILQLTGENSGVERRGAWVCAQRTFDPPIDMREKGLGVWVHGDGKGEVLNFQMRSPRHLGGGLADHYVRVDFEGWRYCELVEPESDAMLECEWPHLIPEDKWELNRGRLMSYAYPSWHVRIAYDKVESLNIWMNNIPENEPVECGIGPVMAVPLQEITLSNPSVEINGQEIALPVELRTGSYVELRDGSHCTVYDQVGTVEKSFTFDGVVPVVAAGDNTIRFSHLSSDGARRRAKVTLITYGEVLEGKGVGTAGVPGNRSENIQNRLRESSSASG